MTTLPLEGGCHCGALRFRVSKAPIMVSNCHCRNCQKIGGAAFATNAIVPQDGFEFTAGEAHRIEWTSASGRTRFGWFCGDCGSRIAHGHAPSTGTLTVRSGVFDDVSWVEPVGDIWTSSAQPWVTFGKDRLSNAEQPSDLSQWAAAYRAQGRFA